MTTYLRYKGSVKDIMYLQKTGNEVKIKIKETFNDL